MPDKSNLEKLKELVKERLESFLRDANIKIVFIDMIIGLVQPGLYFNWSSGNVYEGFCIRTIAGFGTVLKRFGYPDVSLKFLSDIATPITDLPRQDAETFIKFLLTEKDKL
ncbi:MAG: hypothetical protein Q7R98_00040 [Candidatus Jorgensenbacteria bacterium]|nr:hypothetical protein [Candidatus Jorgensenbacteria bacterium]